MRATRASIYGLTAILVVAGAAYAPFALQGRRAAQPVQINTASLYQLFEAKKTRSFEFADSGWAYHVETPARDKMFIAGVKGPGTQAQAVAAFNGATKAKAADLMISRNSFAQLRGDNGRFGSWVPRLIR